MFWQSLGSIGCDRECESGSRNGIPCARCLGYGVGVRGVRRALSREFFLSSAGEHCGRRILREYWIIARRGRGFQVLARAVGGLPKVRVQEGYNRK